MDNKSLPCPFSRCKNTYTQSRGLKQHLRTVRGGGYDELHPNGDPEWKLLDDVSYLKVHTRPGDMSEQEKEDRRAKAQKRHYDKHKQAILDRSRERRNNILSSLQVANKLGVYAQTAKAQLESTMENLENVRTKIKGQSQLLQSLYGPSDQYKVEAFIQNTHTNPDIDRFPRLIAYVLPLKKIPEITAAIPGETLMLDAIPGSAHYHEASKVLHPDKNPCDGAMQTLLNDAWKIWEPILKDPKFANVTVVPHGEEATAEFCEKGDDYRQLLSMYYFYLYAYNNCIELMTPSTLSLKGLEAILSGVEEEERLLQEKVGICATNGLNVDELIAKALTVTVPTVDPSKRKRGEMDGRALRKRVRDIEGDGELESPVDSTIDPSLVLPRRTRSATRGD